MNKWIFLFVSVFIILSLSSCGVTTYQDTNGPSDYSLQTLTEEDIIRGAKTSKILSSSITLNNKTVCKAKTMSGVEELYKTNLKNETLCLTISSEITKGNARLVIVFNDEIIHDFALHMSDQIFTLEDVTGTVSLKLAGESTGYEITYLVE